MGRKRNKRFKGGFIDNTELLAGNQGVGVGVGETNTSLLVGASILLSIFTIIIPILASLSYELPVQIMFGFYCCFLFAYGYALDYSQTPRIGGIRQIGFENTLLNNVTNWGLLRCLLPITFAILCLTYKHYTVFLPVSFALIGAIVLINFVGSNNLTTNILTFLLAIGATGTMVTLVMQQFHINTKGGSLFKRDGSGEDGNKPNYQ